MLDMNTCELDSALREMLGDEDYVVGGSFQKHGLVWELEKGLEGHAILSVWLAQRNDRGFKVFTGMTASCENDRERFVATVSRVLKCQPTLSSALTALKGL